MANNGGFRWGKWLVMVIVIALIIGAAWFVFGRKKAPPQYQTEAVDRGNITNAVTATGTLNPVLNVQVGCQVSGRIKTLYADFNTIVHSNELIGELDPSTYQAQVNQAKADLANAGANLELQQIQAKRSIALYTNNLISESDRDIAVATRDEAAAMVQIKEAALTNSMANLGYCKIYSPVDGIVISRNVEVGQTVAASFNAPVLFQIANDLTKMQIDSTVAEADIGGVVEGQKVEFNVDAFPFRTFHGVVTQVRNAPTTVNNVVTYDCVISVNNSDLKLKPGMTANVSIIIATRTNVLEIPNAALRFHPPEMAAAEMSASNAPAAGGSPRRPSGGGRNFRGGAGAGRPAGEANHPHRERAPVHTVYVLRGEGDEAQPAPVQIRTGITDEVNTEVTGGDLKEGDQIITGEVLPDESPSGPQRGPFGPRFRR